MNIIFYINFGDVNELQFRATEMLFPAPAQSPFVSVNVAITIMGMRTILYGYIEEMDFWQGPIKGYVRKHNSAVINSLPKGDKWPPLSKEMFSICNNYKNDPGPNFEYSGRIIHFGANLKSVELDWIEWKTKFEGLLGGLFFLNATVHFKTEYSSVETSTWGVNLLKYSVRHDSSLPDKVDSKYWEYDSSYDQ